jgi:signal recognition particle subunit SRP54
MFENLTEKLSGIFGRLKKQGRISRSDFDDVAREVRIALLEADVNQKVVKNFIDSIKEKAIGEQVWESLSPDEMIIKIIRDELVNLLGTESTRLNWSPSPPTVLLLCGLQGSGKTTTAAKLAAYLQKQSKKPLLAACDLQRPAAIKQLQVLGETLGVPVFTDSSKKDASEVAHRAIADAKYRLCDVVILDTAGRLQIDTPLMEEINRVSNATNPAETLLVVDATTGQEAVNVARGFDETLKLTGLIFTKMDGDSRGGAVLSVKAVTGHPVRFVGVGESVEALEAFDPKRVAERILGFGDVVGLIERAEEAIREQDRQELEAQLKRGKIDFESMLTQFRVVKKMGSMRNLIKLIPGTNMIPKDQLDKLDGHKIGKIEAIILSMTPLERRNPDILSGSRKKRIAHGSGTSVEEVNRLIKGLDEMKRQMKQMSKISKFQKRLGKRRK